MSMKISDSDFTRLVTFIHENYGINLSQKRILIEGRLSNEIQRRGFKDFTPYLDMLFNDSSGTELVALLNKLTTNHTYFMREPEHYEFMRTQFLPYMEQTKKNKIIYIWSAGCSSGEEAYTNEMQMMEYFGSAASAWDTRILATDISMNVLEKAQKGIYHKDSMKNLPQNWIPKYFTPLQNDCYQVKPILQKQVIYKTFNLMEQIPFRKHPFDLIFCRNVMIYFDLPTKVELVKRFYDVLAPGGYLFIGHAESIPRESTKFEYIKPAIYRRPLNN